MKFLNAHHISGQMCGCAFMKVEKRSLQALFEFKCLVEKNLITTSKESAYKQHLRISVSQETNIQKGVKFTIFQVKSSSMIRYPDA